MSDLSESGERTSEPEPEPATRFKYPPRSLGMAGRNALVAAIALSIVIPVYNEAESIPRLAEEVDRVFDEADRAWECVWVDDASSDDTLRRLRELHARDPRHHQYMTLAQRCGQSGALMTGFRAARGEIIATLDGDLQNDPADLPALLGLLHRGQADMVTGVRATRRDGWGRRVSSRIANGFRNWITHDHIQDVGCSLRVFYHDCVDEVPAFSGMHRFLPTLVRMNGFSVLEVPVRHRPRVHGITKYGVNNRLWRGIADCLAVRWMHSRGIDARVAESSLDLPAEERSHAL
ncbi:MAG TPA: glycosyltransferase family 2 protein [Candidatus Krumholzibacteria bacterium]|nr:glycosyltransferase family 2 protein [Candidatus Krumholzibacteria bacterium]